VTETKKQVRAHLLVHGIHTQKEHRDITSKAAISELMRFRDAILLLYIKKVERTETDKLIASDRT
jgi:hypothetical protein